MHWLEYLEIVSTLPQFIRAERVGDWVLHLQTFMDMLAYMAAYDYVNYTRSGDIYLIDMMQQEQTAPEVYEEHMADLFGVTFPEGKFNQVSTDLAMERINRTCKVGGGMIGITIMQTAFIGCS